MDKILVTGCNGQLGSELQDLAKGRKDKEAFLFTDKEHLDITDRKAVDDYIRGNGVRLVVNCAAFTAVDKAEGEPELCDLLNHKAPAYLAEAVEGNGGRMVQVSTDYVFDGLGHVPYKEDCQARPNTVYGATKLEGEKAVMKACPKAMVVRTAWLYSTHGNNFVKTMIRLGRERDKLGVVADQIGTPTYARDLATAILAAMDKGIVPGIYHFSNEGACSWYDFAKAIHRLSGIEDCKVSPLHTEDYPTPAKRPHYSVLDKTKIKQTYSIDIPWWEDSLGECIGKLVGCC